MRTSAKSARTVETDEPLSPQDGAPRKGANLNIPKPRSLAGATVLQLVPALRDDPASHAAIDIALTLLQSGARAIIAGEGGPLVGELLAFGGEWLPMANDTINPLRIRANTGKLAHLIASERIDIIHAQSATAAWSAIARYQAHAGLSRDLVSRPAAAKFLAGKAHRRLTGARRPRDRTVDIRVAGDDRALQDRARAHHRHPARGRYRQIQPGRTPTASPNCAASGASCRRCASC